MNLPTPITSPRLILCPPKISDGSAVHSAIVESFESLNRFMPFARNLPLLQETEFYIRQSAANWILQENMEPYLPLFMFDKNTGEFVGSTGYHHFDWEIPSIETGYWIRTSRSGEGLVTEAINALTQYAFKQLKVRRISIACDIQNVKSRKIPEKLNYELEATLKSSRVDNLGKVSDTLIYTKFDLNNLPNLSVSW